MCSRRGRDQEVGSCGHSRASAGRLGLVRDMEPWGKGEQGREVRMQALRRKKPDQGGGYTRAKLESLP